MEYVAKTKPKNIWALSYLLALSTNGEIPWDDVHTSYRVIPMEHGD